MNWEALSAIATAFTGLVIMFTVIVGVRQARAALEQIGEAHRATQLDGMLRIFDKFDDPGFVASRRYVMHELPKRMKEPDFEDYVRQGMVPDMPWYRALATLERVGVLIKTGLLEGEPFYYNWGNMIIATVHRLQPIIEMHRKNVDNPYLWKDTEWLAEDCARWLRKYLAENPRIQASTGKPFTLETFDFTRRL